MSSSTCSILLRMVQDNVRAGSQNRAYPSDFALVWCYDGNEVYSLVGHCYCEILIGLKGATDLVCGRWKPRIPSGVCAKKTAAGYLCTVKCFNVAVVHCDNITR